MKSSFLPIPTQGLTPVTSFPATFHVPQGPEGTWNDYAAWTSVPAIAMLEVVVFGVGTVMLFLALMSSSISVPSYATYGTLLAAIQGATLTVTYIFIGTRPRFPGPLAHARSDLTAGPSRTGNFSRRTDTNKSSVAYPYAHALYIDLLRAAGYTIAGVFAVFQLKSMCTQDGFLDDKGLVILVVFVGMAAGVLFKLSFNDGTFALTARRCARSDRGRARVPGEIKTRGETLGLWFWLLPITWMAAFLLVFSDVIIAANGSPLASRVYFVASFGLVYMIVPTALCIRGMFTEEAKKSGTQMVTMSLTKMVITEEDLDEASPFDRYTPVTSERTRSSHHVTLDAHTNARSQGVKALFYCAADFLVFAVLVYGTAFDAIGSPFRDLGMFLVPAAPTNATTAALVT